MEKGEGQEEAVTVTSAAGQLGWAVTPAQPHFFPDTSHHITRTSFLFVLLFEKKMIHQNIVVFLLYLWESCCPLAEQQLIIGKLISKREECEQFET